MIHPDSVKTWEATDDFVRQLLRQVREVTAERDALKVQRDELREAADKYTDLASHDGYADFSKTEWHRLIDAIEAAR